MQDSEILEDFKFDTGQAALARDDPAVWIQVWLETGCNLLRARLFNHPRSSQPG